MRTVLFIGFAGILLTACGGKKPDPEAEKAATEIAAAAECDPATFNCDCSDMVIEGTIGADSALLTNDGEITQSDIDLLIDAASEANDRCSAQP